jgi:hypothetical protein
VVGVGKDNLRAVAVFAEDFERFLGDGLDGGGGAYGHEDGGLDGTVGKLQTTAPAAGLIDSVQLKA